MSGTRGYFENGIWVEERESVTEGREEEEEEARIEDVIDETSKSVKRAIDDVLGLSKKMFATDEGRAHLEKKARDAGDELQKSINEVAEKARKVVK
ncbi:MAG: hypothetical protein U9N40_09990 [Euryarchaeota archaeon]|nr:hypothetical protein [Euryarchaeota archaeon]